MGLDSQLLPTVIQFHDEIAGTTTDVKELAPGWLEHVDYLNFSVPSGMPIESLQTLPVLGFVVSILQNLQLLQCLLVDNLLRAA